MNLTTRRLPLSELALCTRKLALMVRAGVPLVSALEHLSSHKSSQLLKSALGTTYKTILEGGSIASGMDRTPNCFPRFYTRLVAAGEHAGILDCTLDTIAEQLEGQHTLRKRLIRAAIYPAVVCITLATVVIFLLAWVIPTFEELFAESGVPLPWLTRILLSMSRYMLDYWLIGAIALALGFSLVAWLGANSPKSRSHICKLVSRIPVWRSFIRARDTSECSALLSALIRVGIPIMEALAITTETIQSPITAQALGRVRDHVSEGHPLSAAFRATQHFPDTLSQMIEVGESSGQLEVMLAKTAAFYRAELDHGLETLKQLIEPALILVIGAIVGTTVLALYLPIFQIGELAGTR